MLSRLKAGRRLAALPLLFQQGGEDGGERTWRMRSDTGVAPLNLKRKPQLLVLLSRVAEASVLEKQGLGTVDGAAAPLVLSGGEEQ